MPLQRQWIVGIHFSGGTPSAAGFSDERIIEYRRRLDEALTELAPRIDGAAVLAAVPTPERIQFLFENTRKDDRPPLHLIMPQESAERFRSSGGADSDDLIVLCQASASINVQPGRGMSKSDWMDCEAWLESASDIRLCLDDGNGEGPASGNPEKPTIRFATESGEIEFIGFPLEGKLSDSAFQETLETGLKFPALPDSIEETKDTASQIANRNAPLTRFLESGSLLLNLAPSLIFGIGAAFSWCESELSPWTFAASLAAALAALGLSRIGPSQSWLSGRIVAEICRSLIACRHILDPLFPPAAMHLPAHASLIKTLSLGDAASGNCGVIKISTARDSYLSNRLDRQIDYFRYQAERAKVRERGLKQFFYIATALAFVVNLLAFLFYLGLAPYIPEGFLAEWIEGFGSWVFPAAAAGAIGFLAIHETSRRAHVYQTLADQLFERRNILSQLHSESSITEAVRESEHFLAAELADWLNQRLF